VSKQLVAIKGFEKLSSQIKKLPDKVKRKEVLKILGQVANPTVKVAKQLAPVSKKAHVQKRKGQRFGTWITPGTGKMSIGKKTMRRAQNPTLYVSPMSTKKADGYYLRQFVIPGTKYQKSNAFIDKAYSQTKAGVTKDAEVKIAKYIQKQINKLS
jgi:HK97 gp10 family phage protein